MSARWYSDRWCYCPLIGTAGTANAVPRTLQFSPFRPQPPDAECLGVEQRQVPAVIARDLYHPRVLHEVLLALLQERPEVGGLGQAQLLLPATRAHDDRLRAHPLFQNPSLRRVKGHE